MPYFNTFLWHIISKGISDYEKSLFDETVKFLLKLAMTVSGQQYFGKLKLHLTI